MPRTFGFSLAGGLDLDENTYPDLAVGSYDAFTVTFFRARPVVKMDSYVQFESDSRLISLDHKNCTLSDKTRVPCLSMKTCIQYTGEQVMAQHTFEVQLVLDVKKTKSPRLFFLEHEGKSTMNYTLDVRKGQFQCRTKKVSVLTLTIIRI